ncbi:MAG: MFS transporter [Deltaproteobacteria bacterium]|nr:MFS transporter [Deltaproteobacteria bacterium]
MLRPYLELPRAVHILCAGAFVNRAGAFVVPFLSLYLARGLGLGDRFATFALGVFGAGGLIAALAGGALADRLGRRPIMLLSLFGSAAALIVLSQLRLPALILAGVFAFALFADLYRPASAAMIADLVLPEARPRAYSLMYVAINLGFAVGATVGGQLAVRSFLWLFLGDAASAVLFGLLILIAVSESRAGAPPAAGALAGAPPDAGGFRPLLSDRPFLALLGANFLVSVVFHQAFSTLPLSLARTGIGPDTYGAMIAINGLLIVLVQLPLTHHLGETRRGPVLALGALTTGIGFGLTALVSGPGMLATSIVVWTTGEMLLAAFNQPAVSALAPAPLRARYFGALNATWGLALGFGPPLGGVVLETLGTTWLWTLALASGCGAAAVFFSLRKALV